ncbi:MAG: LLM class flavin-dependent oxidoreductase, partial [Acidimicrobiia bacterium]
LAAYVGELAECWSRWPDELSATGAPDVFAAALHPVMARTAARACGGVLLHPLALLRTHLTERVLPAVRRGADDRNGPVAVAAWCVTSIDDDAERAREHARRQIAFYFSTPSYGPVTAGTEWEPVAAAVRSAFEDSGRAARFGDLAALVPDSLVDELAVAGDAAEARSQAQQRERVLAAAGIGEIVFQTVGADVSEAEVVANCHRIVESLGPGTTAATGDPHETVLGAR